jgi:hypothetical protein
VPVLDSGARGSTTTFVERGIGDVLLAWENEAFLAVKELGRTSSRSSRPSLSILAEPPVAVVDKVVDKRGTRGVAQAYLEYLYSPEGQDIAAKNYYRPIDAKVAAKYAAQFPSQAGHHRRGVRRLAEGAERRTSPTAAVFDRGRVAYNSASLSGARHENRQQRHRTGRQHPAGQAQPHH